MGKLICESSAETLNPSPPPLTWHDPSRISSLSSPDSPDRDSNNPWNDVRGLEDQQRRCLRKLYDGGVFWKKKDDPAAVGIVFRLSHGGDVESDGNCLFTASRKAMELGKVGARELRQRTVKRFLEDYQMEESDRKQKVDEAIKHLYSPDLKAGWGIHVVQEVKLLARKADREVLDSAVQELQDLGMQRYNHFSKVHCLD